MRRAVLFLGLVVGLASLWPASAIATFPGANGKFAFSSQRDGNNEIYTAFPETRVTTVSTNDILPAWNQAGTDIAFSSNRGPAFSDYEIYRMSADGSGVLALTNNRLGERSPSWSPSGTELAIERAESEPTFDNEIVIIQADGSGASTPVTAGVPISATGDPDWSPDGQRIAFSAIPGTHSGMDIFTINPNGSGVINVTNSPGVNDVEPSWSPDSAKLAFASQRNSDYDVYSINANGTGETNVTNFPGADDHEPAWSPDGTKIAFNSLRAFNNDDIYTISPNGTGLNQETSAAGPDVSPSWQRVEPPPLPTSYARPKGATPFRAALVVAGSQCTASNRTHGPPLAFPSCNPPVPSSTAVTVGTPDSNGAAADLAGAIRFDVLVGTPAPPDDSDVRVEGSISGVRCKGATTACGNANAADGPDYTGQLEGNINVRITDRFHAVAAGGGTDPGTVVDIPFPLPISCANTASTAEGGLCSISTSMNGIVPGTIKDGKRAIFELSQVTVTDGGPDGQNGTAPNTLFLTQGVFVP